MRRMAENAPKTDLDVRAKPLDLGGPPLFALPVVAYLSHIPCSPSSTRFCLQIAQIRYVIKEFASFKMRERGLGLGVHGPTHSMLEWDSPCGRTVVSGPAVAA